MHARILASLALLFALLGSSIPPAQAQGGPSPPPQQGGQPPRQLHPLQQQQKEAQQAQQAAFRVATAPAAGNPYSGPGTEFPNGSPEQRSAIAQSQATTQRLARGDLTPPAPDTSQSALFPVTAGHNNHQRGPYSATHQRRSEEPQHEHMLRLLGLGPLLDIRDMVRWDNSELRDGARVLRVSEAEFDAAVAGVPAIAPDDQEIRIPVGYCSLSAYIWQGGETWLPYLQGIGFQWCNIVPGYLRWQEQEVWLMKCGWYFFLFNLCLQPTYYWFFQPPGQCLNFEPTNYACGPGRYYLWEAESGYVVRDHGGVETLYDQGFYGGYKDSTSLYFRWGQ